MASQYPAGEVSTVLVDHIPVVWMEPSPRRPEAPLALWLHPLSGTKEDAIPFLQDLAGAGFAAVSFDAWQHGQRGTESRDRILERVFGGFRRHMWSILGQTTLHALRAVDWATADLEASPEVVAGRLYRRYARLDTPADARPQRSVPRPAAGPSGCLRPVVLRPSRPTHPPRCLRTRPGHRLRVRRRRHPRAA